MKRQQEKILMSGMLLVVIAIIITIILSLNHKQNLNVIDSRYFLGLLIIILGLTLFIIQKIRLDLLAKKKSEGRLTKFNEELEKQVHIKTDQIRENEERYRTLAGVYQTTTGGTILTCNDTFARMLGYDSNNALLQKNASLFYFSDSAREDSIALLQKKGKLNNQELKLKGKDGQPVYVIENCSLLKDSITEEQIIEGVMVDITERKKAEQSIRNSEETQKLIMNAALDAIVCMDINGNITVWTPRAEMIFGWKEKDILGKTLAETIIPEQYRERHTRGFKHYLKTGEHQLLNQIIEITALNKRGEEFPVELSIVPVKQGNSKFFCSFIRDITERKKAEITVKESGERYRALVESAPEALVVLDVEKMKFVNVSESAERLFRMTREELLNIGPLELSPEYQPDGKLSSETAMQKINDAIAGNKPSFEWTHCDSEGNPLACEVWLVRLPSEDSILIRGSIIDITERKKAQEEIIKTNARFHIISNATSDIVWDWDLQEDSLWWNDNYYSNLGPKKEKEAVSINDWYNRIHPDDLARAREKIQAAIKDGATYWSDEYRFQKVDGGYLHFLNRAYIMRNQDDRPYRMIGSMVDMTPVYTAQKEVAESENRLRTIYETEPECIKLLGSKGELLEMNPAGLAMIEADNLEMVKGHTVLGIVAPEYQKAFGKLIQDVFEGKTVTLEFEIIGLKGTHRWLETHAVPMRDAAGTIIALLGVTRNITERKKAEQALKGSEEKYRTLVEQAVDAIALYDSTGQILDVNTGASELLGYSKEELSVMTLGKIMLPEDLLENPVRYDVLEEGRSTVKQRRMKKKDGTIIKTEVRSQQLPDGRFLSVIRDLTERIKTEQELETSYKSIRKLTRHLQNIREEERAHIAREIHDELGQQLTVLKMDVSWLIKKIDVSDEVINEKVKALIKMLDETVTTVRRISSELRPSLLDDLGLMAAIEWQLHEFEKRSDIKTKFAASEAEVKLSNTVKTALFRIFQESLTNVARHSGAQKVLVNVKQENNNFVLSITDNGRGFDKQKIADKRTLGILGMKERTSMIGGTYEITTSPGKGTAVVVAIPIDMLSQN